MLLSIIIPAHNEEKVIKKTLKNIKEHLNYTNLLEHQYEIIVMCDACTDRTTEKALKGYSKVKLFHVHHKTASLTRNEGVEKTSGQYLLFLDADTHILNKNTIKQSISLLKKNNEIKVVGSYWYSKEQPSGSLVYSFLTNWFLYFTNTCPGFYLCCRKNEFVPFKDNDKNEDIVWCKEMCGIDGKSFHFKDGEIQTSMRRLKKIGLIETMRFYTSKESFEMFMGILLKIVIILIIIVIILYGNIHLYDLMHEN